MNFDLCLWKFINIQLLELNKLEYQFWQAIFSREKEREETKTRFCNSIHFIIEPPIPILMLTICTFSAFHEEISNFHNENSVIILYQNS